MILSLYSILRHTRTNFLGISEVIYHGDFNSYGKTNPTEAELETLKALLDIVDKAASIPWAALLGLVVNKVTQ